MTSLSYKPMKALYLKSLHYLEVIRIKSRIFFVKNFKNVFSPRALAILFIVAFIVGVGVKSLLNNVLTIGYEDYTLKGSENALDLNLIQKNLIEKGEALAVGENVTPSGEVCSE